MTITDTEARTLELAARYTRLLAAVERAHHLGFDDEVASILSSIDPVDCKFVVAGLEGAVLRHRLARELPKIGTASERCVA